MAEVEDYAQDRRVLAKRKTVSCFGRAGDATRGQGNFGGNSQGITAFRARDLYEADG